MWRVGWRSNRFLLVAVAAELGMLLVFLYFPPIAHILGQAGPTWAGFGVALMAIPAVIAADTAQKAFARRRRANGR